MTSDDTSKSSTTVTGKLLIFEEYDDGYDDTAYGWSNQPGLPVSVRQSQAETTNLHVGTKLLHSLTVLLESKEWTGWLVICPNLIV